MAYAVEITDTFGGEANYSWVRRFTVPGTPGHLSLVRQAKKQAGWSGLRCSTWDQGDMIEVRPVGRSAPCWVMFINWVDDEPDDLDGTSGQDRESYSDDQDRDSYTVST